MISPTSGRGPFLSGRLRTSSLAPCAETSRGCSVALSEREGTKYDRDHKLSEYTVGYAGCSEGFEAMLVSYGPRYKARYYSAMSENKIGG